jgi:nucleoside 2-deoxyribosyltransferase
MWFDETLLGVFESGFAKAISDSGYTPFRIDRKEHNQKIDDEIVAEIRRSKFVVADFTGHRGGVYFEAGFAMGLGLPIIWTCRRDNIAALHFDIRQYNCIDWTSPEDLCTRLSNRIVALLGHGGGRG